MIVASVCIAVWLYRHVRIQIRYIDGNGQDVQNRWNDTNHDERSMLADMANRQAFNNASRGEQNTRMNQAHTCKTLGVVTIPKSLLARMRRSRVVELISYTRPRPAPLGAGRGREHESMSSRACHVKHHAS